MKYNEIVQVSTNNWVRPDEVAAIEEWRYDNSEFGRRVILRNGHPILSKWETTRILASLKGHDRSAE